jgi:hypothetical protein
MEKLKRRQFLKLIGASAAGLIVPVHLSIPALVIPKMPHSLVERVAIDENLMGRIKSIRDQCVSKLITTPVTRLNADAVVRDCVNDMRALVIQFAANAMARHTAQHLIPHLERYPQYDIRNTRVSQS